MFKVLKTSHPFLLAETVTNTPTEHLVLDSFLCVGDLFKFYQSDSLNYKCQKNN
jgi:hypothetical protein